MYKVVNGTSYHSQTPEEVVKVLEKARSERTRIRIDLGYTDPNDVPKDKQLGQSWGEVHDVVGYVGRSTGTVKIPLLVYNSRSLGGGGILDTDWKFELAQRASDEIFKALDIVKIRQSKLIEFGIIKSNQ